MTNTSRNSAYLGCVLLLAACGSASGVNRPGEHKATRFR